jgi:hypothetical protein
MVVDTVELTAAEHPIRGQSAAIHPVQGVRYQSDRG